MTSVRTARLITADVLAGVTLLLSMLYVAKFYEPGLPSLASIIGRGPALLAIVFSIVAFVLSVRIRSPAIAGLLIIGGILMQIPPVQAIVEAGAVMIPGPIFGVISFAPILILGMVKAIGLRPRVTKGRTAAGGYSVSVSTMVLSAVNQTSSGSWTNSTSWGAWGNWGGWWTGFHGWERWPFGFPFFFPLGLAIIVGIVLVAIWLLTSQGRSGAPENTSSSARRIIEERYAKGEITKEQFEQMKKDLLG